MKIYFTEGLDGEKIKSNDLKKKNKKKQWNI